MRRVSGKTAGKKQVSMHLPSYRLLNVVHTLLNTFAYNAITGVHFLEEPLTASHAGRSIHVSAASHELQEKGKIL